MVSGLVSSIFSVERLISGFSCFQELVGFTLLSWKGPFYVLCYCIGITYSYEQFSSAIDAFVVLLMITW